MERVNLLRARVGHERTKPAHNRFLYEVFYVDFPVTATRVALPRLFSFDRFNLFSLYTKDHGAKTAEPWLSWFRARCEAFGIAIHPDYSVRLITHPRVFGFVFNPISFWLLLDSDKNIRAVLCEVRNTFGDHRNYLLAHEDGRVIVPTDVLRADKKLYVSPFNTMEGYYRFSFALTEDSFSAHIAYCKDDEVVLDTFMKGARSALSTRAIIRSLLSYPFMTLVVVYRIHYQALRLFLKRVRPTLAHKPARQRGETTFGSDN